MTLFNHVRKGARRAWLVKALPLCLFTAACAAEPPERLSSATASSVLVAAAGETNLGDFVFPNSPYGNYLAGLVAGQQRDLSAAADFMLSALESEPDNPQLLRRAFTLVTSDGRYDKSVELARQVLALDATDSTANLVLAVEALHSGDKDAAETIVGEMPERGLSAIARPMLYAWILLERGDLAAGLESLAALQKSKGFEVLYQLQLALLNDVAGEPEAAKAAYGKMLKSTTLPSLRLILLAGNFFERQGLTAEAGNAYDHYAEANPETKLLDAARRRLAADERPEPLVRGAEDGWAEVLFTLASLLNQERAAELGLIHAHQALRLAPRLEVARILLGEILEGQNRNEDAIATYRQVDPASPLSWSARLRIAETLGRLERHDESITELEALANERPEDYEPLFRIGNLLRNLERFGDSVAAYDRAFDRLSAPAAQHWSMLYFRGIALERSGQWERAEKDFLGALELEPEQPYVMNYLAYSWVEKHVYFDRAKQMLVRAVELRPNDGFIVDSLGWVFYRLDEFDKAVGQLERAVELRPQDPVINDHLGDAYWQVGRRQEARFQWRRALSLEPEDDQVQNIETKIKRGLIDAPKKI